MQSKNDSMISVHFQGKPFNTTVIQVYVPTTNAEKAEVEQFYETYMTFRTPEKDIVFITGLQCKSRNSRDTWNNRQLWP